MNLLTKKLLFSNFRDNMYFRLLSHTINIWIFYLTSWVIISEIGSERCFIYFWEPSSITYLDYFGSPFSNQNYSFGKLKK